MMGRGFPSQFLTMTPRSWLLCAVALVLAVGGGRASPRQDPNRGQQPPSFRSGVTVVPIDVRVIGRDGQPVTNLTKEDFTILEDGAPQTIAYFFPQILVEEAPRPGLRARPDTQPFDPTPQTQRVFLIVLGTRSLGDPQRRPETLNALVRFVRESLLPQDQVALLAYNRATDFTSDHEKIAKLLETFKRSEAGARTALSQQGGLAAGDAGSVFAPPETLDTSPSLDSELGFEEYVRARGTQPLGELDSLFYGIKYLRYMSGEKHLVFVTERGPAPTWDQVKYLTSLASDARVALDTIQLGDRVGSLPSAEALTAGRGGSGSSPGAFPAVGPSSDRTRSPEGAEAGRATGRAEGGTGGPVASAIFDSSPIEGFKGLYDLRYVAAQTGGQASILKDARVALARIDTTTRAHYLLGYYPTNGDWNAQYRSVRVEVNRPDVTVLFRHGYYARRESEVFDRRRIVSNSRIESAGYQLTDIRDIDLKFVPSFKKSETGRGGEVLVPLSIDVTRLAWGRDPQGRHAAHMELAIYCGDGNGKIIGETRRLLNLALTDETFARVMKERLSRELRVTAASRPQFVKVIAYDYDADRVGSALVKVPR
jgi:VWFA-related protein